MTLTRRDDRSTPPAGGGEINAGLMTESSLSRFAGWVAHAPAERLPLASAAPVWLAALIAHGIAHLGHVTGMATLAAGVSALAASLWAGWLGDRRAARSEHPRVGGVELAIATGAVGTWVTLATALGPLWGPYWLLSLAYGTGVACGYWWLRRHPAVLGARARRDEAAARHSRAMEWVHLAQRVGLRGSHLDGTRPNNIGLTWIVNTHGTGRTASQVDCRHVAERLAGELSHRRRYPALTGDLEPGWVPKGRVEVRVDPVYADLLTIMIRNGDPWAKPVLYPALEKNSPYAAYTPVPASIRNPIAIGTKPETGGPFPLVAYDDEDGGKQIVVFGQPGAGKSTLYAAISAGVTACPDAALLQINIAKPQTDQVWAPAAAATATGDPASAIAILAFASCVVALRSDPGRGTSHPDCDTHLPTAAAPAYFLKIDEGRSLALVPGAPALVEHIMQAGRSEAVTTMLALHRSTAAYFGNANIRALTRTVIAGNIPGGEVRRMLSEDAEIPDMRDYGEGQPGVFLIASRFGGQQARGRTWSMTKDLRNWRKIAEAHAAARDPFTLDSYLADLAPGWEALQAGDYREAIAQFCGAVPLLPTLLADTEYDRPATPVAARQPQPGGARSAAARKQIAAARATLGEPVAVARPAPAPAPASPAPSMGQKRADLPTRELQDKLRALLARPGGVTSRPAAADLGVSHTVVQQQLRKWQDEGTARWDQQANTWRAATPGSRSVPYLRPVPDAPDDDAEDAPGDAPEDVPGDGVLTGAPVPAGTFTPEEMALIAASWMLLHGPEDGLAIARRAGVPEEVLARASELLDTDRPYVEAEMRRWTGTAGGDGR
jgi:hypothetical protein